LLYIRLPLNRHSRVEERVRTEHFRHDILSLLRKGERSKLLMNIRLEFKKVHYHIRGVPTERWRMIIDVDDVFLGQIHGPLAHICVLLDALESHSPLDIINDPRRHKP